MNWIEKIIGELKLSVSFLNRSNSPSTTQKINDSQTGHVAGRDVNVFTKPNGLLSDLEKTALKVLHREHRNTGYPRARILDLHRELGIGDGQYVGTLSNSAYLSAQGEFYVMTDDGIRYMDNLSPVEMSRIVLPAEQRERQQALEIQRAMITRNEVDPPNPAR